MAFEEGVNQIKTQKWMEILESKNQKLFQGHKLAHDLGAGSPCLQCKDNCPGLDLHFWRKVCKNCKCKKESHDVQEEDDISAKFEILFGLSKCTPSQAVLDLKLRFPAPGEGDVTEEEDRGRGGSYPKKQYTLDWVPPNISSELAAEYMQQLPASKLPISGSDGALYRRQQLEKQVPLHDLNANLCHNLTSDEVKCLSDYLENLKQNVAGQGKIMKLPNLVTLEEPPHGTMPSSFSADAISSIYNTVPKPFKLGAESTGPSTNEEPEFPPPPPELLEDTLPTPASFLKPPSAFIKKSRTPSPTHHQDKIHAPTAMLDNDHRTLVQNNNRINASGSLNKGSVLPTLLNEQSLHGNFVPLAEPPQPEDKNVKVGDFIRSLNSKANNEASRTNKPLSGNIATNGNINQRNPNNNTTLPQRFETKPYESTINSVKIESFNQLDEKINAPNKMMARHLDTINMNAAQNGEPRQELRAMHPMEDANANTSVRVTNLDDLMDDLHIHSGQGDARSTECQNFLTKPPSGKTCKQCLQAIRSGDLAIYTEKLGDQVLWHPQCFVCTTCNELLVDLMYFHYKSNVYCLRDYAQMLDIPRCHACDELIFVNEYTLAENKTFHVKHFCCFQCDKELCNQSYIPVRDQRPGEPPSSHPYCLDCYYKNFSKKCSTCKQVIDVQDKCIQFNNEHYWHIKVECFACVQCRKYLNNERFIMQFEKPFCSRQCVLDFSSVA